MLRRASRERRRRQVTPRTIAEPGVLRGRGAGAERARGDDGKVGGAGIGGGNADEVVVGAVTCTTMQDAVAGVTLESTTSRAASGATPEVTATGGSVHTEKTATKNGVVETERVRPVEVRATGTT